MSFFAELKRRNVFKVAAAYIIVGWLLLQVSDTLVPALYLPEWFHSGVAFLLIIGFPIAVIFAWAFEMTPEGLRKEKDVERSGSITEATGQKLNYTIIGLMAIALVYFAWDKYAASPGGDFVPAQTASGVEVEEAVEPANEPKPDSKSIAVIPFQNRSANEENAEFFSDGVHDELLTNLSRIHELKVISRTSVMNYRDTTKNMRQIGEELGAAKILEGGVQRAGNTVRINVQLIDAATDEHLWAEVYDRQLTAENVFAIQTEISRAIANALEATLSPQEEKVLSTTPTSNLAAYDNLLMARLLFERGNWQDLLDAKVYLEKSIELDPDFTDAHVLLARTCFTLTATGATSVQDIKDEWDRAIQTALSLDENSATAYAVLAQYLWQNNLAGVEATFEKARQLEPHNSEIMIMYAEYLRKTFSPGRAQELYEIAKELDPISMRLLYGLARVQEAYGELDNALETYARIRQLNPANSTGYGPVSGIHMLRGEMAQSIKWLTMAIEIDPKDSDLHNHVILVYLDLGDHDRARQWLSVLDQTEKPNPMTIASLAMLNTLEGNMETAFPYLRRAFEERMQDRWGSEANLFRTLLIWAIDQGQTATALEMVRNAHPDLFEEAPFIDASNILQAIDSAYLLRAERHHQEAERLLNAVVKAYDQPFAVTEPWLSSGKAQALAMLGEELAALNELRFQVNNGWRSNWQTNTDLNPAFESISQNSEYKKIVETLRADMATQLPELRAMEDSGEVSPPLGGDRQ